MKDLTESLEIDKLPIELPIFSLLAMLSKKILLFYAC